MQVMLLFKKKRLNVRLKLLQLLIRKPQITNPHSNPYKSTAVVLGIAPHILFKHVGIKKDETGKRSFLNLLSANKHVHGINLLVYHSY